MSRILPTFFLFLVHAVIFAQTSPVIGSWLLNTDAETGYANISSNVQSLDYTDTDVYISCTCIPGYDIGPWVGNPNTPANQDFVFKITRNPQENNGVEIVTPLGHIGVWSNGVSIFNAKDAFSYNNQNVWFQNAVVVEGPSFDLCGGHPAPNGEYHHHLNPSCLYDVTDDDLHSPIIGYAFDAFPIYGAHAYSNTNGTGEIRRMESSYRLRDIADRTTLPDGSEANFDGPLVSNSYPLGYYVEDFEYVQDLGDLDEHNGRWCITPEYPEGIYAYFCTVDPDFTPSYPYVLGTHYFGSVQNGNTGPQSGHNTIPGDAENWSPTAIFEFNNSLLTIYPNPTQGYVYVTIESGANANCEIFVYDSLGKLYIKASEIGSEMRVDLDSLPRGVYFIRVSINDQETVSKIVLD